MWLPENHLVFFLLDLAAELDLEAIDSDFRRRHLAALAELFVQVLRLCRLGWIRNAIAVRLLPRGG